jgi:hypothetical protein
MKLVALLLVAMTIRLTADNLVPEIPLSATFKYRNGVTVTLVQGPNSLAELTISSEQMKATIPHEELKDIVAPEFSEVHFTSYIDEETGKPRMDVTLKYNARPYEWGDDVSKVIFRFTQANIARAPQPFRSAKIGKNVSRRRWAKPNKNSENQALWKEWRKPSRPMLVEDFHPEVTDGRFLASKSPDIP